MRKKTGTDLHCQWCKKQVYVPSWRIKGFKFCSRFCAAKYNFTGSNHYNWKGGRIYHADGYIYIYSPDHRYKDKHGYVFEHRLIMERKIGRLLYASEHIHHINGIKDDNRIENLLLLTNEKHLKLHWQESNRNNFNHCTKTQFKKGLIPWNKQPTIQKDCLGCKNSFIVSINSKKKYCNYQCYWKDMTNHPHAGTFKYGHPAFNA